MRRGRTLGRSPPARSHRSALGLFGHPCPHDGLATSPPAHVSGVRSRSDPDPDLCRSARAGRKLAHFTTSTMCDRYSISFVARRSAGSLQRGNCRTLAAALRTTGGSEGPAYGDAIINAATRGCRFHLHCSDEERFSGFNSHMDASKRISKRRICTNAPPGPLRLVRVWRWTSPAWLGSDALRSISDRSFFTPSQEVDCTDTVHGVSELMSSSPPTKQMVCTPGGSLRMIVGHGTSGSRGGTTAPKERITLSCG